MLVSNIPRILIAGVGNELRCDDAFGLLVARELQKIPFPKENLRVQEVGIGGIHLVQELHNPCDILLILDAVNWGGRPGEIFWRTAETADINGLPPAEKRSFLADMHYATPVRALMLAKAVQVLPPRVFILGCEALVTDDFEMRVSKEVEAAIPRAVEKVLGWLKGLGILPLDG